MAYCLLGTGGGGGGGGGGVKSGVGNESPGPHLLVHTQLPSSDRSVFYSIFLLNILRC